MEAIIEAEVAVGEETSSAIEILETLRRNLHLQEIAKAKGVTPELLDGIREKLPSSAQADLKNNDIAFYLTRLTLAGELERGAGRSLFVRHP